MEINGRQYQLEKTDVKPEYVEYDSGYVLTSKKGIKYRLIRNNHRPDMLFAMPEDILKHAVPNIWISEMKIIEYLNSNTLQTTGTKDPSHQP